MKIKINLTGLILFVFVFIFSSTSLAVPPPEQETGGQERMRQMQETEKALREKIEKKETTPSIEEKLPEAAAPEAPGQKIFVKKINVKGCILFSEEKIKDIISPFENRELDLREMQKVADLITDLYRSKGYITSRAYLPPQKIEEGVVEISILESTMGDVEVKGNRFFKTSIFRNKIAMKKGGPFNYNILKKGLVAINERPDRKARAVLMPAKEQGGTDTVLEVKDNLPVHIGLGWDNYGSRYIDRDRYNATLTHNNITGHDDSLTFQYQFADEEAQYKLNSLRYLLPVNNSLDIGFTALQTKSSLTKEYEPLMSRGKSSLYSIYAAQSLIKTDNAILNLNLGFDYKDIFNFQLGQETSRDRMRIIKTSLDLDLRDRSGRTIITNEISHGIPNIMGGLKEQDSRASRSGSGGAFTRDNINLLRLQNMPLNSTLLWKNQLQFSPYILTSSEQFQIGGIANVRGYPPAEYVGDSGYSMTWEWTAPPYGIPKDIKVPFSKGALYDSFRLAAFYDWATVDVRRPAIGEKKNRTLRSPGCGIRINLPENFSARLDFAWSWDNVASDGHHLHKWAEITKNF